MNFEVYSIGFTRNNDSFISYIIKAYHNDAIKEKAICKAIPKHHRHHAELISIAKALQSIKPEFRSSDVKLYIPTSIANYFTSDELHNSMAHQQIIKNAPIAILMVKQYSNLLVNNLPTSNKMYRQLVSMIYNELKLMEKANA